ncbi:hypothetical protein ZWY2020_052661 [Hordeum vulgare]|nr:hypothetical protein ZWY2020_052661 [Hordeum vulgare]
MSVVGLDVGNDTLVAAAARQWGIDVLLNAESNSKREWPAAVAFSHSARLLGAHAAGAASSHAPFSIPKRFLLLGRRRPSAAPPSHSSAVARPRTAPRSPLAPLALPLGRRRRDRTRDKGDAGETQSPPGTGTHAGRPLVWPFRRIFTLKAPHVLKIIQGKINLQLEGHNQAGASCRVGCERP